MDQPDNNLRRNHHSTYQYSNNYIHRENCEEDISSNHERDDENHQSSHSFVYKKRIRTKFSVEQLDILESTFQQHRYPSVSVIDDLVEQLNLSTQKITDEDVSHDSSVSPPINSLNHLQPAATSHSAAAVSLPPSSYYLPNSHISFYNPMWSNFHYPLHYNPSDIPPPIIFHDTSNYQYEHNEL
ncbi:unnamed protein product [Adineta ricciae]|uniref:Homeobox domain-containing protein n=1 Tax=Adineta ricciae TaxID=249248 RepID=A0A815A4X0_ADIRI|nr:unnamed protein product [Adineta ricciae]CAF1252434.1 unnamed protein product [Adineta ricciae]